MHTNPSSRPVGTDEVDRTVPFYLNSPSIRPPKESGQLGIILGTSLRHEGCDLDHSLGVTCDVNDLCLVKISIAGSLLISWSL